MLLQAHLIMQEILHFYITFFLHFYSTTNNIETGKSQYVNINVADANDIYKYICINDIVTTREILENFNISIDEAKEILIELFKVNRAIRPAHLACNPEDENCQWSKYY